ncbi:MAG: ATP-binding protein [Spirosomataceae bacterium]|jgi:PAS domain S-box-containing protein
MSEELEILKRRIERERKARIQAEDLLEKKAFELYEINSKLEREVEKRTMDLKYSEEKYRDIMENLELGMIEVDNNEVITKVFPSFKKLTGYDENDLLGKLAHEVLLADPSFLQTINSQNSRRKDGESGVYEVPLRKKNGEVLWVIINGSPIRDSEGNIVGSVGIHYDITYKKRTQEALEQANFEAEKARMSEKRFLANMSHEIRTPINGILGMAHLLADTMPSPKQSEYIRAILYSADMLQNLVSDILDISKIEAGEMQMMEQAFSMKDLINSILQTFRLRLSGKNVELEFKYDEEIENEVIGDSTFLTQILMNLLSNAAKFTEEGKIGVEVGLLCKLGDYYMTEIKVSDTGKGIPKNQIGKIFDSFKQVDEQNKSKYGGTGLGLAIVKQLVNLHGGEISVESEVGIGSTFIFTLPLKDSMQKPKDLISISENLSDTVFNAKILLAEDNMLNQKYAESLLNKWGIEVSKAENGLVAVQLHGSQKFDLILMDLRMPELDGYEATKIIRDRDKETPIVALTASAVNDEIDQARAMGMNDILTKPFAPNQLKSMLGKYLTAQKSEVSIQQPEPEEVPNDYLEKIYGNDIRYASDMFELFLNTVPAQMTQLEVLVNEEKVSDIGFLAHQMKPSFSMVGLPEITAAFQSFEKLAKSQPEFFEIKKEFRPIKTLFENKIDWIKSESGKLKAKA